MLRESIAAKISEKDGEHLCITFLNVELRLGFCVAKPMQIGYDNMPFLLFFCFGKNALQSYLFCLNLLKF